MGANHTVEDTRSVWAIKGRAEVLYVCADALVNANRIRINALALALQLPTMHSTREYARSRGPDRHMGQISDSLGGAPQIMSGKILRGTKPSDLPVEQPTQV